MPRLRTACLFVSLCALTCQSVTRAADAPTVDPSRFEVTRLATGLMRPMELAVAPDGTIYYIELDGKLQHFDPRTQTTTLAGELKVTTAQENGLIGIALDPDFAKNHWVFLQYSPPDFPGQHISRFTLQDGKLDLASEKLLLKYEEQRKECCHHAGSLAFGPRGELFIATGDNTHPGGDSQGFAPIDERPDRAPFDAQKSSSNTNSYNGKILRIRPLADGTYEIPEGNLFPRDGSKGRPEIYVMGCRNPWRVNVDAKTGYVYWGEVGPDAGGDGPRGPRGYDEINQARKAGNFGWPYFIANNLPYSYYDFATNKVGEKYDPNGPENRSPNNTGEKILPPPQPALIYYPYGASTDFPELGTGGRTACAGPVYHYSAELASTTKFPEAYDGALFIYEWTRHWVKVVSLDADAKVKRIEPFLPGYPFVRPIDMEFGPDGSLYVIEYGESWGANPEARLVRIDYIRGNRAPKVVATAENNFGKQPLAVKLSSQGTIDKDASDELKYEWRVTRSADPNAVPKVVAREANPTVTFDEPGVYNVELFVTDPHGASGAASVPVLVGNARPAVRFLQPQDGDFFTPGEPIAYRLYASDLEDGTSDADEADEKGLEAFDSSAVDRISLNAVFSSDPIPSSRGAATAADQGPPGLKMMKGSDCFNCHAVDQKRVGPPLLEIANKYRGQASALDASIQRVLKGSTGVWGKVPMIPHSQHTVEDIREMVTWIYSLQPSSAVQVFPGFVGAVPVAKEVAGKPGHYRLEATYVDRGSGEVPALSASSVMYLRPRLVEAETADDIRGPQVLSTGNAGGGKFIGAINHGHHLRFNEITLDRVKKLTLRVTSAGTGGAIEVRLDKPDGELLATAPVENNGSWDKWYDRTVDIAATGRRDLFIRFINDNKASGLMNLDSIYFHP